MISRFFGTTQVVLDKLNILSKFYVNSGKIVASNGTVALSEELGRDVPLRTIIGTGEGGSNPDTWGVGFLVHQPIS